MVQGKIEIVLLLWMMVLMLSDGTSTYRVETQVLKDTGGVNGTITHFVHDSQSNVFYVGATNRIYKLSSTLEVQQQLVTGPEQDNVLCSDPCIRDKVLTNNYNKILLIEKNINGNNRLIVCGSLFQGYCERRDLNNISRRISTESNSKLVANEGNASTVGLIVTRGLSENVMYIGASYPITTACVDEANANLLNFIRQDVPALSMRRLIDLDTFTLYQKYQGFPFQSESALRLNSDDIRKYVKDFVSAFSVGNFTYFLTVQPYYLTPNCFVDHQAQPSQSKISLTCHSDTHFYSYVEIPLNCIGNDIDFNFVSAGKSIIPGQTLRNTMGIMDQILVALFQKRHNDGRIDSAVCVYSLSNIRKIMKENLKICSEGDSRLQGKRFVGGATCVQTRGMFSVSLCNTMNSQLGRVSGVIPAQSKPAIIFRNTALTSVTLTTTSNFTVAFLGTAIGRLKKIVIENISTAKEYDSDLVIDDGSRINQDTVYDADARHLYLTSQRLVAKIPVENCTQYKSCTECLSSRDPFCGWCTLKNRCTLISECSFSQHNTDRWKIGKDGSKECTAIDSISPPQASSTEDITVHANIKKTSQFITTLETKHLQQLSADDIPSSPPSSHLKAATTSTLNGQTVTWTPNRSNTKKSVVNKWSSSGFSRSNTFQTITAITNNTKLLNNQSTTDRNDVSCNPDSMSVYIPSALLSQYNYLTWTDPRCKVINNGTHYISTVSHTACGTIVKFTHDEVIFENDIFIRHVGATPQTSLNDTIDFGGNSADIIPVQCIYPRRQNVTMSYLPANTHIRFYEKRYGHMDVQLEQYQSDKFVSVFSGTSYPTEVPLNKDMYIKLRAMHTNTTDIAIKVDSCVATPSAMPADGSLYQLIDHGCPASPAVKLYPSSFDEVKFSIKAFEFKSSPGSIVYIHCQISVCSPTHSQCVTGCKSRHRRDVDEADDSSHLVSGGPYLLVADKGSLQMSTVVAGVCACLAVVATGFAIIGWKRKSTKYNLVS